MAKTMRNSWLRGSCIGRGAYGTVSAAVDTATGDVFAVKSVDLSTASPSQVEALESEIAILKSLSSPFIVKYLGDDTTAEGSPPAHFRNLHMEYLPGGTAAELADPSEDDVASYAWCLVSALGYLHSRGVVHCDVKGKNVLLGASAGSAALADLGSAVEGGGGGGGRGSPLWMAPEAIRGERQGPEADVWSVGCTVIEMVTGKPAWGGSLYRIGYSEEVPRIPARLSSLGVDFVDKCLRRDYAERWSCDQLLQHPFISMRSRKDVITNDWSPRCVLDCITCEFQEEEEEEEEESSGEDDEMVNLERIRGLASGAGEGANWESDGWLLVRGQSDGGNCSDLIQAGTTSSSSSSLGESSRYHNSVNSNFDFDPAHRIVVKARQCYSNSNSSHGNVGPEWECTLTQVVERLYDCSSNYGFVYHRLHIIWNFGLMSASSCTALILILLQPHGSYAYAYALKRETHEPARPRL